MTKAVCAALTAVLLAGCATPPAWLAAHYNAMDECQRAPAFRPQWCGAGGRAVATVKTTNGATVGTIWTK